MISEPGADAPAMPPSNLGITIVTCEYPPFPGGIGTYAHQLSENLKRRGCHVTVIAPKYAKSSLIDVEAGVVRILRHHKISVRSLFALLRQIRNRPLNELFLAADIRSVIAFYLLKPLHGRSFRAMVHGSEASKFDAASPRFQLAKLAYRAADEILYNSKATQEIFEGGFGRVSSSRVTYLGVDEFWFEPTDTALEHSRLADLTQSDRVVCSVGRIEPRKGHIEAIRALALAQERISVPFIYVVAGRAEGDQYLANLLREADRLSVRLVITGRLSQSDVRRLYGRSLCQLLLASSLPGKMEGFGLVLLEAAAQHCPTIATRSGGIPEVLGESGVLVNDTSEVADAICRFATDVDARLSAGDIANRRAREFTWEKSVDLTFPETRVPSQVSAG